MSVQTQIDRIKANIASAYTKAQEKGAELPPVQNSANLPAAIEAIPSGGLPPDMRTISVSADPQEGGSVSGGGVISENMEVTAVVSATPSGEYDFDGWEEDGAIVSREKRYAFPVTGDVSLVGKFSIPQFVSGKDWWETTLPLSDYWQGIAYGGGKFIVVPNGGKCAYSVDGVTWSSADLPSYTSWYGIAYGNGNFVVTAYNSNKTARSSDGTSWEEHTLPSSSKWYGLSYGDGKFVSVADDSNIAAYSADGTSWATAVLPSSSYWRCIAYGGEKFVAIAYGSNKAAYSSRFGPNV